MISVEQMRLLHALARQVGEGHEYVRDRAAAVWDIGSLKELTVAQARQLIDEYQAEIKPPKPPEPASITRFHFGSLPKRVAAKAVAQPPKPVTQSSADLGMPPIGKPVPNPADSKAKPGLPLFAARLGIDPEMEKIPW